MRGKPKKRLNRYNPNKPDYKAVHSPVGLPVVGEILSAAIAAIVASSYRRERSA